MQRGSEEALNAGLVAAILSGLPSTFGPSSPGFSLGWSLAISRLLPRGATVGYVLARRRR